jgi:hypothetical protein
MTMQVINAVAEVERDLSIAARTQGFDRRN